MKSNIDYEKLKKDLTIYYGTASPFYPVAIMKVFEIDKMDNKDLIEEAINCKFNLDKYKIYSKTLTIDESDIY